MQRIPQSDLDDFIPLWERKLDNVVRDTEFDRLLGSDIDLLEKSVSQGSLRNRRALAQDVFDSFVVRQGGSKR